MEDNNTVEQSPETPPAEQEQQADVEVKEEVNEPAGEQSGEQTPEVQETEPEQAKEVKDVDLDNPAEVGEELNKRGVDYAALSEEYAINGKLSDKSMKALEEAGIPKEMVDNYIRGYEARAEIERNELAECIGGREEMDKVIDWASRNLKKDEIIALNAIRNKFELESVLRGLKVRMEEKEGKTPTYQKGTGDTASTGGFRSQAEMFEAIKDPRYSKDEAYRSDVQKKIAASRLAGINLGIY